MSEWRGEGFRLAIGRSICRDCEALQGETRVLRGQTARLGLRKKSTVRIQAGRWDWTSDGPGRLNRLPCTSVLSPRQTTPPFLYQDVLHSPERERGHGEYVHGGEG